MKKRLTKDQREALAKDALRKRIQDIVDGACGYEFTEEEDWLTAETLSRVVPTLKSIFQGEINDHGNSAFGYCFMLCNLHHFNDVESITTHLFDAGIRA